jgi:hypothetical protein
MEPEARNFLEMPRFLRDWTRERMTDEDLLALQIEILSNHSTHPVVPGCEGFRKVRLAVRNKGKSGGARVYYADLPQFGFVIFGAFYLKSKQEDLSPDDKQELLAEYYETLRIWSLE